MNEDLMNRIADQLLIEINNWEEEGLDADQIESKIDDWFEDVKLVVKSKV